jgi:hypothetical protein
MGLLSELDAFFADHHDCATWTLASTGWSSGSRASARTVWPGESMRPTMPTGIELDARGRRLRASLAAVIVRSRVAPK